MVARQMHSTEVLVQPQDSDNGPSGQGAAEIDLSEADKLAMLPCSSFFHTARPFSCRSELAFLKHCRYSGTASTLAMTTIWSAW